VDFSPVTTFGVRKHCAFVWYQNICSIFLDFVAKHAFDGQTDRRTDRLMDAMQLERTHGTTIEVNFMVM